MQLTRRAETGDRLAAYRDEVREALAGIPMAAVERVVEIILTANWRRRRVYIVGNGGSASTAAHFAADLSKATIAEGRPRLRVLCLADNAALLTAWANDTSYERVFAEQLESLLDADDVVIAISVSGNSPNVVNAVSTAHAKGAITVGLLGAEGGALRRMVHVAVQVPSHSYGVVEDCHIVLEHAITESTRSALCAS